MIVTALIWTAGALAGIAMLCLAGLSAWRGWLDLRRDELASARPAAEAAEAAESQTGARIEMADVRERLRKLEAIARGVDL
jgi:hypothetical protein